MVPTKKETFDQNQCNAMENSGAVDNESAHQGQWRYASLLMRHDIVKTLIVCIV